MATWPRLPLQLLKQLLCFLDLRGFCGVFGTCAAWRDSSDKDALWRLWLREIHREFTIQESADPSLSDAASAASVRRQLLSKRRQAAAVMVSRSFISIVPLEDLRLDM